MRTYTIVVEPAPEGGYFVETHMTGLQADGEPVPQEAGEAQLLAVTVAA
jgi:hypothetical protein